MNSRATLSRPRVPAAVLSVRFEILDAQNGVPGRLMLAGEYPRRIPLKARTADALMEGWKRALAQILANVLSDLTCLPSLDKGGLLGAAYGPPPSVVTAAPSDEGVKEPSQVQ